MENQQELYNASKQTHLSSESLDLEDLQDQNHVSSINDPKQDEICKRKNENEPENFEKNEDPNSKKSFLGLKRELAKYKKLADERQLQILKEQNKTREISSKLDAATLLNQKYENELKSLSEQKDEKTDDVPESQNDENYNNALSMLEKALQSDSDDLSKLSSQRLNMFQICHTYQQCLEAADKEIQNLRSQIQSQEKDNFENLLADILQITNSKSQEEEEEEEEYQSPRERILAIVQQLYDDSVPSQEKPKTNDSKANGQILGHLENALYFIRTLKNSTPDEQSSLKDAELRKAINQQCKQIEDFLSENKPEAVTSLFNNSNVDEQLKTFYDFIDENEKTESPFRELYSLFTAAIEVNQMLFERNNELTHETQKSKVQAETLQKELDQENANCDQKDEIINELLDQMEKTLEQRPKNILSGYHDVCLIINELMNELAKNKKEVESLNRKCKKAKKANDSAINEMQSKEKQIEELNEKYSKMQKQSERQRAQLEANISELKNKHQEVANKVDSHSQKTQKLKDQNKDLQAQIEDLQKQNAELHNKIADYMQNEDFTTSTINGFENRVSKMKIKNARLKKKNNELETQLRSIVDEIKTQNESLEKSYQNNLQQLSNENEELRARLDEEIEANKRNKQSQNEYQTKVAKMKLNELQRSTELNEAKKSLQMLEQQSDAKLDAQRIAYEEVIQKLRQHSDDCALRIALILDEDINQVQGEDDSDDQTEQNEKSEQTKKLNIDKLIDSIEGKIHPNLINDARETKTLLNLDKNDSIYTTVKKLIKGIMHKDKVIKDLEKNNNELKNITKSLTAEELSKWKNWGNKLYCKINGDDEPKPYDQEKTRESIERVLDDIVNPESSERKLDILKSEKIILSKFDKNAIQRKSTEPVESIRAITLLFMLIGRLQRFSQTVQLPYKLRMQNNQDETENEQHEKKEEEEEEEEY